MFYFREQNNEATRNLSYLLNICLHCQIAFINYNGQRTNILYGVVN